MAGFKTGLAWGLVLAGAAGLWAVNRVASAPTQFTQKSVYVAPSYLIVEGSIIGDEKLEKERPMHNMAYLYCTKDTSKCQFLTVNELSPGLLGGFNEDTLRVRQWTDREMVADSLAFPEMQMTCFYFEIRVIFSDKTVTYTRLPNPRADVDYCKGYVGSGNAVRQWRIGSGKGWHEYKPGES